METIGFIFKVAYECVMGTLPPEKAIEMIRKILA